MRWLVLAAVVPAMGCDLPTRDNIYDPANAPSIHARVVDHTNADGSCTALTTTGTFTIVAAGPRGHCLAIDARDTTDPQGTPLSALEFEFALLGTAGDVAIVADGPFGALDADTRALLPVGGVALFGVRVSDPGGASARSTVPFVALNEAPVAATVPARRELPLHGFPWIGVDQPVPVRFSSAASFDPDGDPLSASWALDGVTTGAPSLDLDMPTDRVRRVVASLVVRDPSTSSGSATGSVTVADSKPWVLAGRNDYYLKRLEVEPRAIQFTPAVPLYNMSSFVVPGEPEALVLSHSHGGEFNIGNYPLAAPLTATLQRRSWMEFAGIYRPGLAFDRATRTLWAAGISDTSPTGRIASLIVSTDGGLSYTDGVEVAVPGLELHLAAVDASGNLWTSAMANGGTGEVLALRKSDLTLSTLELPGILPAVIAPRPGTGEVWVRSGSYVDGTILRFAGLPENGYTEVDGPAFAVGPAWADSQRFWMWTADFGLALVDADVLVAGLPFEYAVVRSFPEVLVANDLTVDPETGDVWTRDSVPPQALVRASTDGTLVRHEIGLGGSMSTLDPLGMPLLLESSGLNLVLRRTDTPLEMDRVSASVQVPLAFDGHRDPLTGGIWVVRSAPRQLYRLGPDGTLLQRVTEYQGEPLPELYLLRMNHDGTRAWGFFNSTSGVGGAVMLSFGEDGFTEIREVLEAADAADLLYRSQVTLVPARASFAWGVRFDTANGRYRVQTVSTAGTRTDVFDLPVGEAETFFDSSTWGDVWSDDSLCLVSAVYPVPDQANAVHVRRVTASGTTDLGVVPINSAGARPEVFVSTTEENGNPLCWVGVSEFGGSTRGVTVFAVDQAGAVVHRMDILGPVLTSLDATSDDEVLFGALVPGIGVVRSTLHAVTFLPASVTGTSGHLTFDVTGEGQGPLLLGR